MKGFDIHNFDSTHGFGSKLLSCMKVPMPVGLIATSHDRQPASWVVMMPPFGRLLVLTIQEGSPPERHWEPGSRQHCTMAIPATPRQPSPGNPVRILPEMWRANARVQRLTAGTGIPTMSQAPRVDELPKLSYVQLYCLLTRNNILRKQVAMRVHALVRAMQSVAKISQWHAE